MSDFSFDEIETAKPNNGEFFSSNVEETGRSEFKLQRGFMCALALGLTFWFVVALLILR